MAPVQQAEIHPPSQEALAIPGEDLRARRSVLLAAILAAAGLLVALEAAGALSTPEERERESSTPEEQERESSTDDAFGLAKAEVTSSEAPEELGESQGLRLAPVWASGARRWQATVSALFAGRPTDLDSWSGGPGVAGVALDRLDPMSLLGVEGSDLAALFGVESLGLGSLRGLQRPPDVLADDPDSLWGAGEARFRVAGYRRLLEHATSALGQGLPGFSLGVDFDDQDAEARLAATFRQRLGCLSSTVGRGCARPVDLRLGVEIDKIDLRLRASVLGRGSASEVGGSNRSDVVASPVENPDPLHAFVEVSWAEQVDPIEPDEWSTRLVLEAGRIDRLALSVGLVGTGAFESPLENRGLDLDLGPTDRLVGALRYSRTLSRGRAENEVTRLDFALSYEESSSDLQRVNRWLAELTFTRKLADRFSMLVTTEWANQPEFLRDATEVLSGRIAVRWKIRGSDFGI